ncbi:MAG TPA: HEAT repeat domain-containing protein [Candidatus Acidoferrum sp.]|nr:HEAT repeat domain-containing protein [Candidatus Acidoferrum sp.]
MDANHNSRSSQAAARVLSECVRDPSSALNLNAVLDMIFGDPIDEEALSSVAATGAVDFADTLVPTTEAAAALRSLICDYLRPAFRAHPFFTNSVGFAEVSRLLQEIRHALMPSIDLDELRSSYLAKIAEKFDVIPLQGISPKIQNRTIGMHMKDIFIPLNLMPDAGTWTPLLLGQIKGSWLNYPLGAQKGSSIVLGTAALFTTNWDSIISNFSDKWSTGSFIAEYSRALPITTAFSHQDLDLVISDAAWGTMTESGPVSVDQLVAAPRVVLRGDPGSGKSTVSRYLAWAIAKGEHSLTGEGVKGLIPVLIRASEFGEALESGRTSSLESYLLETTDRFAPAVSQALRDGTAILLIDGLDEVSKPPLRSQVRERIEDFVSDPVFKANRMVITTRIVGYERSGTIGQFRHFTIKELSDDQIRGYVEHWYRAIYREMPGTINVDTETQQLVKAITGNKSILRMARNPLLLTIIALIKWQGRALPDSRVLLYDAATQTLIRSWPLAQRGVEFDELFIREWLAPLALHILADRTDDLIDEGSLMDELVRSMRRLKSMSDIDAKSASRKLLDDICEQSGFLLPKGTDSDGRNVYGFLHQTFAEYLAAYFLAGRWEDEELDLREYAHVPYWREVLLLAAGHLGTQRRAKAGKFLEAVRDQRSSQYEGLVHRDLLLACDILCDGVPAGPPAIVESLLGEMLHIWSDTRIRRLKAQIESRVDKLRSTEYAAVLARIAAEVLQDVEFLHLAPKLDPGATSQRLERLAFVGDAILSDLALRCLPVTNRKASEAALGYLSSDSKTLRARALCVLIRVGDPRALAALLPTIQDPDEDLNNILVFELSRVDDPRIIDTFITASRSENPLTQARCAAYFAERHDTRAAQLLQTYRGIGEGEGSDWIHAALLALEDDPSALPDQVLLGLLRTWLDPQLRITVASILLDERNNKTVMSEILEFIEHAPPLERVHLAWLLDRLGSQRGPMILEQYLSDSDEEVRFRAAWHLAEKGNSHAIEVLTGLLSSGVESIRRRALNILAGIEHPGSREWLLARLRDPDPLTATEALRVLAGNKSSDNIAEVVRIMDSGSPLLRARAAELLTKMDAPSAFEAIRARLDRMIPDTTEETITYKGRSIRRLPSLQESAYDFLNHHLGPRGELLVSLGEQ